MYGGRRPAMQTAPRQTTTAPGTGSVGNGMPSFNLPQMNASPFTTKAPSSTVQKKDIQIPDFLKNR